MKLNKAPKIIWQKPLQFIAFGFGVGAIPVAPGTFGTLVAIPMYYWLLSPLPVWLYISLVTVLFILACWLCDICSKEIGVHDHGGMVIDEIIGYFITMIAVPPEWKYMLAGFLLFRLFDIWKPWPINLADQHIKGGFGVMFDDLLAALVSCLCLHILQRCL